MYERHNGMTRNRVTLKIVTEACHRLVKLYKYHYMRYSNNGSSK